MFAYPCELRGADMAKGKTNSAREQRIEMEIIVDAHDSDERAMGSYCYLEDKLHFPFTAQCVAKRAISPLQVKDEVEVLRMPPERECRHEMFVTIRWGKEGLAIPLSQIRPTDADDETREAVADWHYWVGKGYEF